MTKIIVTGSSGMLGTALVDRLEKDKGLEVFGLDILPSQLTYKNQIIIDLMDGDAVSRTIKKLNPDIIVHCAAMIDVDLCEKEENKARNINFCSTRSLMMAADSNTRFIYVSTASVFDGSQGNYREESLPSPLNYYAKTKLESEWFVEQNSNNYVIIRTDIIGWKLSGKKPFIQWIYDSLVRNEKIKMFKDVIFTPISVYSMAEDIYRLLSLEYCGRLNIGVGERISKYEFGLKFAEKMALNGSLILPISVDEHIFFAKRPKNTSLNVERAESVFGRSSTLDDELEILKKRWELINEN